MDTDLSNSVCWMTMDKILGKTEERILFEEWEDTGKLVSYPDFVMNEILVALEQGQPIGIGLANETGCEETFSHFFVLSSSNGVVTRTESYVFLYTTRSVILPSNWACNLKKLISSTPGKQRMYIWNVMFTAEEGVDTNTSFLDVELFIKK